MSKESLHDQDVLNGRCEIISDPAIVLDADGVFVDVIHNAHNGALFFKDPEALLGTDLWDIFSTAQADQFYTIIEDVLETGEQRHIEYQLSLDHGERYFEDARHAGRWCDVGRDHEGDNDPLRGRRKRLDAAGLRRESAGRHRRQSVGDGVVHAHVLGVAGDVEPVEEDDFEDGETSRSGTYTTKTGRKSPTRNTRLRRYSNRVNRCLGSSTG